MKIKWLPVAACIVGFAVFAESCALIGLAVHNSHVAEKTAALTAARVAYLETSPLHNPRLLSISINGGPPITNLSHTIFPYPCDKWLVQRLLDTAQSGQIRIAKAWVGGPLGLLPASEGAEPVTKGTIHMSPTVQVPSNEYRHQYVTYIISVTMDGFLAGATFMQPIKAYILDPGEKQPAAGSHPPPRDEPLANPKPGDPDYCPSIISSSAQSSPPH